jgi:hypothetical protein
LKNKDSDIITGLNGKTRKINIKHAIGFSIMIFKKTGENSCSYSNIIVAHISDSKFISNILFKKHAKQMTDNFNSKKFEKFLKEAPDDINLTNLLKYDKDCVIFQQMYDLINEQDKVKENNEDKVKENEENFKNENIIEENL